VRSRAARWIVLLFAAVCAAGCSLVPEPARKRQPVLVTHDGLVLVEQPGVGVLFLRPDHQIGSYDAFQLDPVTVSYRRESAVPLRPETERIRKFLGDALALGVRRSGIPTASQEGRCVLRVGVNLVDVELYQVPQDAPAKTSYVLSWGRLTMVQELRDSVSGAALMRYAVKRTIPGGTYHGASGTRDWVAIERTLGQLLEDVRASTSQLLPPSVGEGREGCHGGIAEAAARARGTRQELPAAPQDSASP
jgi:hypothetical protein